MPLTQFEQQIAKAFTVRLKAYSLRAVQGIDIGDSGPPRTDAWLSDSLCASLSDELAPYVAAAIREACREAVAYIGASEAMNDAANWAQDVALTTLRGD